MVSFFLVTMVTRCSKVSKIRSAWTTLREKTGNLPCTCFAHTLFCPQVVSPTVFMWVTCKNKSVRTHWTMTHFFILSRFLSFLQAVAGHWKTKNARVIFKLHAWLCSVGENTLDWLNMWAKRLWARRLVGETTGLSGRISVTHLSRMPHAGALNA